MPDKKISYEIKEHLGVINKSGSGWNRELNLVSWNGNDPKYDIREWDEFHEKMSKGITLTPWEMRKMTDLYLENNTDKAVAKGRAIEEERRARMEIARRQAAPAEMEDEPLHGEASESKSDLPESAGFDVCDNPEPCADTTF